jgi:hypothetical protein
MKIEEGKLQNFCNPETRLAGENIIRQFTESSRALILQSISGFVACNYL